MSKLGELRIGLRQTLLGDPFCDIDTGSGVNRLYEIAKHYSRIS